MYSQMPIWNFFDIPYMNLVNDIVTYPFCREKQDKK